MDSFGILNAKQNPRTNIDAPESIRAVRREDFASISPVTNPMIGPANQTTVISRPHLSWRSLIRELTRAMTIDTKIQIALIETGTFEKADWPDSCDHPMPTSMPTTMHPIKSKRVRFKSYRMYLAKRDNAEDDRVVKQPGTHCTALDPPLDVDGFGRTV